MPNEIEIEFNSKIRLIAEKLLNKDYFKTACTEQKDVEFFTWIRLNSTEHDCIGLKDLRLMLIANFLSNLTKRR